MEAEKVSGEEISSLVSCSFLLLLLLQKTKGEDPPPNLLFFFGVMKEGVESQLNRIREKKLCQRAKKPPKWPRETRGRGWNEATK